MKWYYFKIILLLGVGFFIVSCTRPPPERLDNICLIFKQYPDWYWAAQDSKKRWGVPINVQLAIIYQESRFNAKAKPPRGRLLWVIPWFRPSSAYGYSQALKQTWKSYRRSTGRNGASRDGFADATDFIGWFGNRASRKLGIAKSDAYKLYLAYHEGIGGYSRGTYWRKRWLINVAHKVNRIANVYAVQLSRCESRLKKKPWWRRIF